MTAIYREIIRSHSRQLLPQPTAVQPRLAALSGLRAVLFDIYGTMLVSTSGEVGTVGQQRESAAAAGAFAAVGQPLSNDGAAAARGLAESIRRHHAAARARGIEYPEVDIVEIWSNVIADLIAQHELSPDARGIDCAELALHYELRANPTWPMPGLVASLGQLRAHGVTLGIISNAQFYTPLLFPALVDRTLEQLGFDAKLLVFSYRLKQAKPASLLFQTAADELFSRGLSSHEVLYIGNDMLNDVRGAHDAGFRTALFAGDRRSLRWRADDRRVAGLKPDVVITQLSQVVQCLQDAAVGTEGRSNDG